MPEDLSSILESPELTQLATGLGATEGPLWHPGGYLTLVDLGGRLLKWDPTDGISVLRGNTGEGNGCAFDLQGNLIMCEGEHRSITRMAADDTVTTIADRYQGKRFNRPNDLVRRSDGSIYFTDPSLRVPAAEREYGFAGIFRIDPEGQVHLATDGCEYPNGLAFSPDESVMYVAITRVSEDCFGERDRGENCPHMKIRAFDVAPDGSLVNNRIFADMSSAEEGVPDGMKVDVEGRLYCTGPGGVWVFDPEGNKIGVIGGSVSPRNLAFGGDDFRTVYTTPGDSLYSFRVKTPGIKPY
jgi:sugar lactone lactonase YvrE